jgi:hypothetical protein
MIDLDLRYQVNARECSARVRRQAYEEQTAARDGPTASGPYVP